jgi:uncharacterized membrane protein
MQPEILKEKNIFRIFEVGLLIKGVNAILEIASGIFIWFINKAFIITLFLNLTQNKLTDDPNDYFSGFIVNSAAAFSTSSQTFFAFYLFAHGLIKIFLDYDKT